MSLWGSEFRTTLPVCLTFLWCSYFTMSLSLWYLWNIFSSSFELLSGCAVWSAARLFWQHWLWSLSDSPAGHFIITPLSLAVSLNQPRVSRIDFFFWESGCVFPPHFNPWNFFSLQYNMSHQMIDKQSPGCLHELSPLCHKRASQVDFIWENFLYWNFFFFSPAVFFFYGVCFFVLKRKEKLWFAFL